MSTPTTIDQLHSLDAQFTNDCTQARDPKSLEDLRNRYLSRKSGVLTLAMQRLKELPPAERAEFGKLANELKVRIEERLASLETEIRSRSQAERFRAEAVDVTLPGTARRIGYRHPLTIVRKRIEEIFVSMGYSIEDGPEVEKTYYNFEALNIPEGHPARDPKDTFYVAADLVLRTHTSPVQIRTMERVSPPVRIICPGRVYRRDNPDATHSPVFHQFEGLVVDEGITFSDLKGTLEEFHRQFFGENTSTRLRPSFFPFTEPSAEVDVTCVYCLGKGCRVCKQTGWIEVMGCGMVHPGLYDFVKYDGSLYSGFAFGGGIDRYTMLTYNCDLQSLFQNDMRFLEQF